MMRCIPWLTSPTTQSASKIARQQDATHFDSFCIRLSCQKGNNLATNLVSNKTHDRHRELTTARLFYNQTLLITGGKLVPL